MILKKSEHLTRYTISKNNIDYIRLVEKSLEEENIFWFLVEETNLYLIDELDHKKFEKEFFELIH